ncbi:hypothetical protein C3E77_08285 [Mycetocola zhujimingii]|nr:hypothetical protein C3E77_08285 [Mycetocola zhujimingii]
MLVIGVMVLAVLAQGVYLWAASLMFWLGPGQSPAHDEGLVIASATSVILLAAGALVAVATRATAFGVTVGVWAVLLLLNFGLWLVVGLLGTITVVALGCVWLVRSRRLAPSRPIRE